MTEVAARGRVLAFVARYPGVHAREVERELGFSSRLAQYHLDALEREGRVRRVREKGYARFLASVDAARLDADDLKLLCILRRPPALRIVLQLLADGSATPTELAEALALAKPSVSYHLRALEAGGAVETRSEGREKRVTVARPAAVRRLLAEHPPTPSALEDFERVWQDLFS